jgi:hypothetical protein
MEELTETAAILMATIRALLIRHEKVHAQLEQLASRLDKLELRNARLRDLLTSDLGKEYSQ